MTLEHSQSINLDLVKRKMHDINQYFDPDRIFKNANKVYTNWDQDIGQLTNKPIEFIKVIKRLQREFKYKSP